MPSKVLLVEDSKLHAAIVQKALAAKGVYDVTHALSVKEAMLQAARKSFDLAIVDYMLPDGDGLELLDSLRTQRPGLPVLFFTAYGSEDIAMQAMSRGAADYVVKGKNYGKELAKRVEDVLGRKEDYATMVGTIRTPPKEPTATGRSPLSTQPAAGSKLLRLVKALVVGDVKGAAIFDSEGRPIAADLPNSVDGMRLGTALVGTQFQAQHTLKQLRSGGPPSVLTMEYEDGLLTWTVVKGPLLVALMFDRKTEPTAAVRLTRYAAEKVWGASKAS
ncbi:MAG: response regulator [Euryarchaeota archaeon]|nr:response regulator [Euryarchaeota archaeon]